MIQNLERHFVSSDQHMKELTTAWRSSCDDAMLHATARCMSSFSIMERIYEDAIHKKYQLRTS